VSDLVVHVRPFADFGGRYAPVLKGLDGLPNDAVVDGEVVALDLW
jgi:hypothetical protein